MSIIYKNVNLAIAGEGGVIICPYCKREIRAPNCTFFVEGADYCPRCDMAYKLDRENANLANSRDPRLVN